jgi:Fe2+ or Zn2+ uptake regulation protein
MTYLQAAIVTILQDFEGWALPAPRIMSELKRTYKGVRPHTFYSVLQSAYAAGHIKKKPATIDRYYVGQLRQTPPTYERTFEGGWNRIK